MEGSFAKLSRNFRALGIPGDVGNYVESAERVLDDYESVATDECNSLKMLVPRGGNSESDGRIVHEFSYLLRAAARDRELGSPLQRFLT